MRESRLTEEQIRAGQEAWRASATPLRMAQWLTGHDAEVWSAGAKMMARAIMETYGTLTFTPPRNPYEDGVRREPDPMAGRYPHPGDRGDDDGLGLLGGAPRW